MNSPKVMSYEIHQQQQQQQQQININNSNNKDKYTTNIYKKNLHTEKNIRSVNSLNNNRKDKHSKKICGIDRIDDYSYILSWN